MLINLPSLSPTYHLHLSSPLFILLPVHSHLPSLTEKTSPPSTTHNQVLVKLSVSSVPALFKRPNHYGHEPESLHTFCSKEWRYCNICSQKTSLAAVGCASGFIRDQTQPADSSQLVAANGRLSVRLCAVDVYCTLPHMARQTLPRLRQLEWHRSILLSK